MYPLLRSFQKFSGVCYSKRPCKVLFEKLNVFFVRFATDKEFRLAAREDLKQGKAKLKSILQQSLQTPETQTPFSFPLTQFVAIFGGPALHG